MSLRTVLIVGLAVVFGLAAAVYAVNVVNKTHEASPETVDVVITAKEVEQYHALTASDLKIEKVTKDSAFDRPDALHSIEEATADGGRRTEVKMPIGDIVLESKLLKKGAKEGMAPLIRKGADKETWMQAATILTPTAASGVGGFIRPGDFVDVLLTVDHFKPDDTGGTIRLMQRVEVLATDNRLVSAPTSVEGKVVDQREMRYVTLLVKPDQAQELAQAQKFGTLALALRNPEDTTELPTKVVTAADLKIPVKGEEKKPEVVPAGTAKTDTPAPAPPPIRVIQGGSQYPVYAP